MNNDLIIFCLGMFLFSPYESKNMDKCFLSILSYRTKRMFRSWCSSFLTPIIVLTQRVKKSQVKPTSSYSTYKLVYVVSFIIYKSVMFMQLLNAFSSAEFFTSPYQFVLCVVLILTCCIVFILIIYFVDREKLIAEV